jgi:hypothetical protein
MLQRIAFAASLVAMLALAGAALAGNGAGPNKSTSSISPPIVVSSTTALTSTTSAPHYGDAVTFNVSTTSTDVPFVNLRCYQNGALVANGSSAFSTGDTFNLTSGLWTGGAADCTANLYVFMTDVKTKVLASTSFHVDS